MGGPMLILHFIGLAMGLDSGFAFLLPRHCLGEDGADET